MTPILAIVATVAAGLFAGAALYVTLVEHPARVAADTAFAVREFAHSYPRAARMRSRSPQTCLPSPRKQPGFFADGASSI